MTFAEARLHTGRPDEARRDLEEAVGSGREGAAGDRVWIVLGRAREAAGDRRGALEAYARSPDNKEATLGQARLLVGERRWQEARAALAPLLAGADGALAAEPAQWLGEVSRGEGDYLAAAEYFMTAAYLAPASPAGRRALLGAAEAFAAINERAAATILYQRLLAQGDLPADVADAARRGLVSLGR